MPIVIACKSCQKRFRVADEHADKLIRCPNCRAAVRVGKVSDSATPPPSSRQAKSGVRRPGRSKQPPPPQQGKSTAFGEEEFIAYDSVPQLPRSGRSKKASAKKNKQMLQLAAVAVLLVMLPGIAVLIGMRIYKFAADQPPPVAGSTESEDAPNDSSDFLSREPNEGKPNSSNSRPPAVARAVEVENPIEGHRVAWLYKSGNGYARLGGGWIYNGAAADVPFHSGSGDVQFPLVETMRTDSIVELFDPSSDTRIRLTSNSAIAYLNDGSSEFEDRGGSWKRSTRQARWLSKIPETRVPTFSPSSDRLEDVITAVEPNVVRVDVTGENDTSSNGSGFLVDPSGRIVTNYHVVEGSKSATVVFQGQDGDNPIRLDVVGFLHLDSKRDIAVLQVKLPREFRRPGLRIADEEPKKGTRVVAFGAPLGLDFTATEGIISGTRSAAELEKTIGLSDHAGSWLQTDAPISPGNSGGPLVDRQGHVVGINTMTLRIGQQLNFALSSDDIRQAVEKAAMHVTVLTPEKVPVRIAQREGPLEEGPGGRQFRAIEGTEQSKGYLKDLQEFRLLVLTTDLSRPYDARIAGEFRNYLSKAIKPLNVRVVLDEGPVLLVVVSAQGDHLDLAASLIVANKEPRKPAVRIWRNAGDMGKVTRAMHRRKKFSGAVEENLQEFFGELHDALKAAKSKEELGSVSQADRED